MGDNVIREKTCCFTGHRTIPREHRAEVIKRTADAVRSLVLEKNVRYFGVGGAIGYDTLAAEVLFALRETEFIFIKVILVYPFDGFTSRWNQCQRETYNAMLPKYDKTVCVSTTPSREAYLKRNRHLVDGSKYCISYCTRNYGGTAYTVEYAKRQGLIVRNIFD